MTNLNIINEIANMSKKEIEKKLDSIIFNEQEREAYEKCKDFLDYGFKIKDTFSKEKVFKAGVLYYYLKFYSNQNN